jgi:ribosomal protein S18 acetylase RimI-like enzyme
VDVTSLGFQTDIALLKLAGSTVEDRGDHLVVRSPGNPSFYWGNFLLLDHVPDAHLVAEWLERFEAAFPEARHRAFGFDLPHGTVVGVAGFAERGLEVEVSSVMTASVVHPPPHPNEEAVCRPLEFDSDWSQSVELNLACYDSDKSASHRAFVQGRARSNRSLVTDGHGQWFGAFIGDALVAQMGIVSATPSLARFQSVESHPDYRGRGLAGTLAHHVSRYAFEELGAQTLVMVADPEYLAIRIYRALGFSESERQLQAERAPEAET